MTAAQSSKPTLEPLKVYWQPGCTGCLRMKEFLTNHGVDFVSVNVLEDREGLDELVKLAGRHVPIARRGDDWVDGQVLADLARIAGVPWGGTSILKPPELVNRVECGAVLVWTNARASGRLSWKKVAVGAVLASLVLAVGLNSSK